jgi:hypothetical protein
MFQIREWPVAVRDLEDNRKGYAGVYQGLLEDPQTVAVWP